LGGAISLSKIRIAKEEELSKILFFAKNYRPDIELSWLSKWIDKIVVLEKRGRLVGSALCSFDQETFIHFMNAKDWNSLVELAKYLLDNAFETGSTKVKTFVPANKIGLQMSLTKLGFEYEGRLRKSMFNVDGKLIDAISMCKWTPDIPKIPKHVVEPLEFHIRPYRSEDYGKILELSKDAFPGEDPFEDAELIEEISKDNPELNLIALDNNNRIVGGVFAWEWAPKNAWIYLLAVLHSAQGHHVGTLLLQKLEKKARRKGILRLQVDTSINNFPAILFYLKNGFEFEYREITASKLKGKDVDDAIFSKSI